MKATRAAFAADVARINAAFEKAGALVAFEDGFVGIDESKAPAALVSAYKGLTQMGYANGWI